MWMEDSGLQAFEAARARTDEFSESRFWRSAKEHLDLIRDAAEYVGRERRLGGYANVIAHHRRRISHLKLSLLLWMFRHGVRRLDPAMLRRVEIDELRERLGMVE